MAIFRKIIAASIAAAALAVTVGVSTAEAAPVIGSSTTIVRPLGGGQGNWPI
ncbi:MAG: hypothetical protein AAGC63_07655 [Propionicimonas sp.]|nr:hypothetical protein [Propionicimonas sp.]